MCPYKNGDRVILLKDHQTYPALVVEAGREASQVLCDDLYLGRQGAWNDDLYPETPEGKEQIAESLVADGETLLSRAKSLAKEANRERERAATIREASVLLGVGQ